MCGIAGIARIGVRPLPGPEVARAMAAALGHRGPDQRGEFRDDDVHLIATRLAIQDLEHGDQPASSQSGRSVAVYNGEIYNFRALARELEARGCELPSSGDTIVLPHLYEWLGERLTERLRGMYAFAIWDRAERKLLLCRDRLGIKPLYLARSADHLLFASEIKALFASRLVPASIDRDALDDLFSLSYPCPPRTMFRGIEELRPAHRLVVRAGSPPGTAQRYWRAPFAPRGEHLRISRRDAEAEFRARLREKVEDHLQADVPVATFLSGGLDSSLITALTAEVRGAPPETFSIGFTSEEHDERSHAELVARTLHAPHHVVECGPETAELYPEVVYHTELPLQYPLALPLMRLSALVRERGFPVVLTGEGADEQLAGYDCYRTERLRRALDHRGLRWLRPAVYRGVYQWLGSPEGIDEFFALAQRRPSREIEAAFGGVRPAWFDIWTALDLDRTPLLSPDGRRVRPIAEAPAGFEALVRPDVRELHPVDAALSLELETRLPAWILLIGDRASMARSVEARVPFLDHEIVEWLARLHPSFKLRGLTEKSVLRGAARGLLPESIRLRPKKPFYTPITEWFFAKDRPEYVDALLSEDALRAAGLFSPQVVSRLHRELETVPRSHMLRMRLEWILMLVLGSQILHHRFVGPVA
jgi:asparagine synthase (glutamine-hydrolysing)